MTPTGRDVLRRPAFGGRTSGPEPVYGGQQRIEVLSDRSVDDGVLGVDVAVGQLVAHRGDVLSRNCGFGGKQ